MKVLLIGGTGMLGEPVARQMQKDGYAVRVMSRSPKRARERFGEGFEVCGGDVDDADALKAALEGCDGVHINLSDTPDDPRRVGRGAANVVEAAAATGLTRLSFLSGASVFEENRWYVGTDAKFQAEAAIRASGVPYSIFNATWFMESLPNFAQGDRGVVIGDQPHPIHWVAAADYARMVSKAYALPEAENKSFFIYGPEAYTMRKAIEIYCAIVKPGAPVTKIPFWMAWLISRLSEREALRGALPFLRYTSKVSEGGDPSEANDLLGAPTITLEAWCQAAG